MINFKKMDDKDFVVIRKPMSDKEDKVFSDFLKNRKTKVLQTKKSKKLHENFNLNKHEQTITKVSLRPMDEH